MLDHIKGRHRIEMPFRKTSFFQWARIDVHRKPIPGIVHPPLRNLHASDLPSPLLHLREKKTKAGSYIHQSALCFKSLEQMGCPFEDKFHHLLPGFDRRFLLGQILLIKFMEGFIRWSWIQIDELAGGAFHHLEGPLPVNRNSTRGFTKGTNYLFQFNIW